MSEITIKRIGSMGNDGYWQASDGSWSPNGVDWLSPDGELYSEEDYIQALKLHLDSLATEPEPERAKVGDWVRGIKTPECFRVKYVDNDAGYVWSEAEGEGGTRFRHGDYTIVPESEPATFTGDVSKLEPGVYWCEKKKVGVVIPEFGRGSFLFDASSSGSIRNAGHWLAYEYVRVSDVSSLVNHIHAAIDAKGGA